MDSFSQEGLLQAVNLMAISARTAPKARGNDYIGIKIISGQDLSKLADAMVEYGKTPGKKNYVRDGENIKNSGAVLLLSLQNAVPVGLNCGACGENDCAAINTKDGFEFDGPLCAWRLLDLGVALGSAVKTASMLNIDNRVMYRAGAVAKQMKLIDGQIVVGIPVSVDGKNMYFDRK